MLPDIHRSHVYWVVIYLPGATPVGAFTWEAFVEKRELGILIAATPATPATQSLVTTGKASLALGVAINALALQQHIC